MNNTHLEQTKNTSSLLREKDIKSLRKLNRKSTSIFNSNYHKIEQKLYHNNDNKNKVIPIKGYPCYKDKSLFVTEVKNPCYNPSLTNSDYIKRLQYEEKKISPNEKNYIFRKEDIPIIKHLLKRGELIDTKNNLNIDLNLCKRTRRNSMNNN